MRCNIDVHVICGQYVHPLVTGRIKSRTAPVGVRWSLSKDERVGECICFNETVNASRYAAMLLSSSLVHVTCHICKDVPLK